MPFMETLSKRFAQRLSASGAGFTVIVDEELLKEIDDFRFENRYPSRSAATIDLIRRGIEQLQKDQEKDHSN